MASPQPLCGYDRNAAQTGHFSTISHTSFFHPVPESTQTASKHSMQGLDTAWIGNQKPHGAACGFAQCTKSRMRPCGFCATYLFISRGGNENILR
jgi:hypothetical protein